MQSEYEACKAAWNAWQDGLGLPRTDPDPKFREGWIARASLPTPSAPDADPKPDAVAALNDLSYAWDALRDDVLHNADGMDNDTVNHYLGLIDHHDPRPPEPAEPKPDAVADELWNAHPGNVLQLKPTVAETAAFERIEESREWDDILAIADEDDWNDALRLFAWFHRKVVTTEQAEREGDNNG